MRRRRRRRAARIRRGIRVGMFACLVLIEASVGSAIMGARGARQEADTEQQQIAAAPVMLQMPEKEDGSGRAGQALRTGRKTLVQTLSGWQQDSQGWW